MTPDDHNTVPQDVPRPDDYAYHMERVMSGLKFRISPENAEFLINLLSESRDDPDRCGECGIDSQQAEYDHLLERRAVTGAPDRHSLARKA